jgi:hypothetical protein
MAYRKSLIQVKFRIRQDVLRRLEREAKREDRSVNDEIGRRLEESFRYEEERQSLIEERDKMREERQQLVTAIFWDLRTHPDPANTKAAIAKMEESAEGDLQKEVMSEEFPAKGRKS